LQDFALVSQHTQALLTQWPLLHWLSWVQVLVKVMLLDEDAPPAPPLGDDPPWLLLPGDELPAFPALLLDGMLLLAPPPPPARLLLELEVPPAPAWDWDELLLLEPPWPALELDELSDDPPEDCESPLLPPLSELLLEDLVAQATRESEPLRIRAENNRKKVERGEGMASEVTSANPCGKRGTIASWSQPDCVPQVPEGTSHYQQMPCFADPTRLSLPLVHERTRPGSRLGQRLPVAFVQQCASSGPARLCDKKETFVQSIICTPPVSPKQKADGENHNSPPAFARSLHWNNQKSTLEEKT